MIINTDFRQYYDALAKQNVDKTVVYNRHSQICTLDFHRRGSNLLTTRFIANEGEEVIVQFPKEVKNILQYRNFHIDGHYYESAILLFCGTPHFIFQRYHDYNRFPLLYNVAFEKLKTFYGETNVEYYKFREEFIKLEFSKIHHLFNSPIILLGGHSYDIFGGKFSGNYLHVNPNLDALRFYSQLDVWQTYNAVYSYLAGVLTTNKETIMVSDKDKILGHGFDPKISFRHPVK